MDDMLVWRETMQEHDARLRAVLHRLEEKNITLNANKCQFCVLGTTFLGHRISAEGIYPDPSKVQAIAELTAPSDVSGVRSFLGMINYLERFVSRLSEALTPIYNLLRSNEEFKWSTDCEKAFRTVLKILTSSPCSAIFDSNRRTVVSADASSFGVGAVLRQEDETEELRLVAYVSRTLTNTERRYAQIEKEILALTWACKRFHDFVYESSSIWKHHRPLVPLLMTKNLDELSPRLQRMRMRLMHYNFECFYTAGKDILAADYLSHSPFKILGSQDLQEGISAHVQFVIKQSPVSDTILSRLLELQAEDPVCKELVKNIQNGWPCKEMVNALVKPFFEFRAHLTLARGFIMFGDRFYIPTGLRREALETIHNAHQGIEKCRARARYSGQGY